MAKIGHWLEDGACDFFCGRFGRLRSAAVIVLASEHVDWTDLRIDRFHAPSSVPACARKVMSAIYPIMLISLPFMVSIISGAYL